MDVLDIPFVQTVGLNRSEDGLLHLEMAPPVANHLNTLHASAQFTLAETASGQLLIATYPDLVAKVVPVLKDSQIRFKRPADTAVTAHASLSTEDADELLAQLKRRGRGSIDIQVALQDSVGKTTCTATFSWLVRRIDEI